MLDILRGCPDAPGPAIAEPLCWARARTRTLSTIPDLDHSLDDGHHRTGGHWDRLGEANCYLAQGRVGLAQGDYQKALRFYIDAYQLYQQIQDRYSQARLLYYRSFVYEAMNEPVLAIQDIETALVIAQRIDLPFLDLFQQRLGELQQGSS